MIYRIRSVCETERLFLKKQFNDLSRGRIRSCNADRNLALKEENRNEVSLVFSFGFVGGGIVYDLSKRSGRLG